MSKLKILTNRSLTCYKPCHRLILGKKFNHQTGGKMKKLILSLALTAVTSGAFAQVAIKTVEIKTPNLSVGIGTGPGTGIIGDVAGAGSGAGDPIGGITGVGGTGAFDRIGQVLNTAQTAAALGEAVYVLAQHGKPTNTTEYAPISVVPRDPISKEIVSPFDMEDCSMPVRKTYRSVITTAGVEVVRFEYMVIYVHSCSYEGAGKYIQTAMIQPLVVKTGYGWDFNATMKLSGIMNHGKKADPIAGALLTIKYSMNSWRRALETNDTVHIRGDGQLKSYSGK